jgi:hypothetical protein
MHAGQASSYTNKCILLTLGLSLKHDTAVAAIGCFARPVPQLAHTWTALDAVVLQNEQIRMKSIEMNRFEKLAFGCQPFEADGCRRAVDLLIRLDDRLRYMA